MYRVVDGHRPVEQQRAEHARELGRDPSGPPSDEQGEGLLDAAATLDPTSDD